MLAAIDVGSNTLRMLVGRCTISGIQPELYQQQITRLGGSYIKGTGLAPENMERTLSAIAAFAKILQKMKVEQVRLVGTAALRRAENAQLFVNLVKLKTGLPLAIISGDEEACLSAAGVLSVVDHCPETALIIDIGGGSTELVFCEKSKVLFSRSYPLGVVKLCEEMPEPEPRLQYVRAMAVKFTTDLLYAGVSAEQLRRCRLIGTAGTITTLAALNLKMTEYDREQINNHHLDIDWLENILASLIQLSVAQREELPGLEPGRGDLIVPGLELVITLCRYFQQQSIMVADAGLLEGILLDFCRNRSD